MEYKQIVNCIYLKDGKALRGLKDETVISDDPVALALSYSNYGADLIVIFDFSTTDDEHNESLNIIRAIGRAIDIPMIGAGNVKRLEDIKKLLYAGCIKACLNLAKKENAAIAEDVCKRFGKDRIAACVNTIDELKDNDVIIKNFISEIILLDESIIDDAFRFQAESNKGINFPNYVGILPVLPPMELFDMAAYLRKYEGVVGVAGGRINSEPELIMKLKAQVKGFGIPVQLYEPKMTWDELKKNSDGMVPVIVQDYKNNEVLMMAYMDEEAYKKTCETGVMTYFSRSRNELWVKGETSGHYQYLKSLSADCDNDTLLARVLQVGAACHTGERSCFFNEIIKKDYSNINYMTVLEKEYETILERKKNPKEGSYTNYLFDKGMDKILKKVGEECTEIIIAAKNPDSEEIKYELADFLYHAMVMMVERDVTWDDVMGEISQR